MRDYKAITEWADDLSQRARERFRCRRDNGLYAVPSESIIRNVLVRVDPRPTRPRPAALEPNPRRR